MRVSSRARSPAASARVILQGPKNGWQATTGCGSTQLIQLRQLDQLARCQLVHMGTIVKQHSVVDLHSWKGLGRLVLLQSTPRTSSISNGVEIYTHVSMHINAIYQLTRNCQCTQNISAEHSEDTFLFDACYTFVFAINELLQGASWQHWN